MAAISFDVFSFLFPGYSAVDYIGGRMDWAGDDIILLQNRSRSGRVTGWRCSLKLGSLHCPVEGLAVVGGCSVRPELLKILQFSCVTIDLFPCFEIFQIFYCHGE